MTPLKIIRMTLVSALFRQFDIAGCGCERTPLKTIRMTLVSALFRHFDMAG